MNDLNSLQQKAYNAMMNGENVFLSGAAGTGKSYVLRKFIAEKRSSKANIIVCAPTGIAALNVGGVTLHRAFNLGVDPVPFAVPYTGTVPETIREADIIVVDEISICRADVFETCAKAIHFAEEKTDRKKQIIVVGDFHQLPPVVRDEDKRVLPELAEGSGYGFAFESPSWASFGFEPIVLTEVVRQADKDFSNALNAVRIGNESGLQWITEHSAQSEIPEGVCLCGTNKKVKEINDEQLKKLDGKTYTYESTKKGSVTDADKAAPDILKLKKGARVISLVNDTDKSNKYQNGSIGTVMRCDDDSITVKFDNGNKVEIKRHDWAILTYTYDKKEKRVVSEEIGRYTQFPLKLAYAITIHKSQGQTYDAVNFYPSCFAPGQLYVGLSRCKTIGKLHLMDELKPENMIVCQSIRDFYDNPSGDYAIHYNYNVIQCNTVETEEQSVPSSATISEEEPKKSKEEKSMLDDSRCDELEVKYLREKEKREKEKQAEQSKPVTMQIRADESTRAQFAELCKSIGMTQGAAMQQLIHIYELDAAKRTKELAGSADVIDDVRTHMDAIVNAFIGQLERNANTDKRFRADYDAQIQSLQTALQDAQKQAQTAQETAEQAQAALDEVRAASEQEQQQAIAQVADANDRADRAEQARQVAEQAASDARRTADALSVQLESVTAERDKLRTDADRAESLSAELAKAKEEITRLNTAAQVAAAQANAEQAQAVAETKQTMQDKLDAKVESMQEKLDELQTNYTKMRDRLDAAKDEIQIITKERDELKSQLDQNQKA